MMPTGRDDEHEEENVATIPPATTTRIVTTTTPASSSRNGDRRVEDVAVVVIKPSPLIIPPWYRDWNFFYVIVLGLGIMCVVAAYWTSANIGENMVEGMKKYGFAGNESFISLGIMYAVAFIVTPVVPIVIDLLTVKWALVAGVSMFILYVGSFLLPSVILLYCASVAIGIGYSIQIASLGAIFTKYSTPATVERNMAFLWGVLNFSLIWGNLFVSLKFQHMDVIDDANRVMASWVLVGFATCGCLVLATLGRPRAYKQQITDAGQSAASSSVSSFVLSTDELVLTPRPRRRRKNYLRFIRQILRQFWQVCKSSTILLCLCAMLFYGVESTFFSAVFPTAVGFNGHFGDQAKSLAGLCGVTVGIGEITGGLATAVVSKYAGRHTTVLIGFIASTAGFIAAVVNVPPSASIAPSNAPTLLAGSSTVLAIVTAYLLGVGDACLSTSVYSLISDVFGEYDKARIEARKRLPPQDDEAQDDDSDATTAAFAIMNAIQSLASAVTFAVSTQIELTWLALVFGCIGAASTISYFEAYYRYISGRLKFHEI